MQILNSILSYMQFVNVTVFSTRIIHSLPHKPAFDSHLSFFLHSFTPLTLDCISLLAPQMPRLRFSICRRNKQRISLFHFTFDVGLLIWKKLFPWKIKNDFLLIMLNEKRRFLVVSWWFLSSVSFSLAMHVWLFTFQGKKRVNFSILNFTLSDILMKTTLETGLRCIIVMCTNNKPFFFWWRRKT